MVVFVGINLTSSFSHGHLFHFRLSSSDLIQGSIKLKRQIAYNIVNKLHDIYILNTRDPRIKSEDDKDGLGDDKVSEDTLDPRLHEDDNE